MFASRDSWPSLRVEIELMPWLWKIRPYLDHSFTPKYIEVYFRWLFFDLTFGANRPMFREIEELGLDVLISPPFLIKEKACPVTGLNPCPWHPTGGNHPQVGEKK